MKLQLGVNDWITKKRNKNETDEDMESRVTAELLKEMQSRAAASTAAEMLRGEVPCSASHESRHPPGQSESQAASRASRRHPTPIPRFA